MSASLDPIPSPDTHHLSGSGGGYRAPLEGAEAVTDPHLKGAEPVTDPHLKGQSRIPIPT